MKYLIKSTKGYWLEKGHGYTQSQNEAYAFTLEEMLHLGFNLDGCTLLGVASENGQQSTLAAGVSG